MSSLKIKVAKEIRMSNLRIKMKIRIQMMMKKIKRRKRGKNNKSKIILERKNLPWISYCLLMRMLIPFLLM